MGTGADICGAKEENDNGQTTMTDVVIDEIIPSESRLSVIVKAYEEEAWTSEDRSVTAYAICAAAP